MNQKTTGNQDTESSPGLIIINSGSEIYRLRPQAQSVELEKWVSGTGWVFEDDISHETAKGLEKDGDVYVQPKKEFREPTKSSSPITGLEPDEVNDLLADYRDIVKAFVGAAERNRSAHSLLLDLRCFWPRKRLLRVAVDLPEDKGRSFLGR